VDKNARLKGNAAPFFKTEYLIVYHEDTGRLFVSILWLDFGSSLPKNVENFSVYLTLQNAIGHIRTATGQQIQ
jgi:hypothetical protein